jgi:hypothetical protein
MKKRILRSIAIAAMTGLVLIVRAQDSTNLDQAQFPVILQQPVDQCLAFGSSATFSVVATNADSYQWYKNNVAIDGETNNSLTISSLEVSDVANYGASVIKGSDAVPTRVACLNVYIASSPAPIHRLNSTSFASSSMTMSPADLGGGGVITVFGPPVVSGGGSGNGCPGKYAGYVNYTKPMSQGWGWAPLTNTTVYTMSDPNRGDTKVQYGGMYGDSGCAPTSVTVPNPTMSPTYRFCVYFPVGVQVPTNAYPIVLTGFNP